MFEVGQIWKDDRRGCYWLITAIEEKDTGLSYMRKVSTPINGILYGRVSKVKKPTTLLINLGLWENCEGYDFGDGIIISYGKYLDRGYHGDDAVFIDRVTLKGINKVVTYLEHPSWFSLVKTVSKEELDDFLLKENMYLNKQIEANKEE